MKHTEARTIGLAKSYRGNSYSIDFSSEYFHAVGHGYIKKVRAILKATKSKNKQQKKAKTLQLAKRYKGTKFSKDHAPEYLHAAQNGYLNELYPIIYRSQPIKLESYIDHVFKTAENYSGTYFGKDHPTEYDYALTRGYLPKLNRILSKNGAKRIKHSKERTLNMAKSFKGSSFHMKYPKEYLHARKHGYLKDLSKTLGYN